MFTEAGSRGISVLSSWTDGIELESRKFKELFLEGDRDAQQRITGLAQDGMEKDREEPIMILLVFRLIKQTKYKLVKMCLRKR